MDLFYKDIFIDFKTELASDNGILTPDITKNIKNYFLKKFADYNVLYSSPDHNKSEFLTDILITNFEPKSIIKKNGNSYNIDKLEIKALLAIESELGGEGGTSAGPVLKNVVEDFVKLLMIKSKYKIMIFTSAPLQNETDHIMNRVKVLMKAKNISDSFKEEILLIHLYGETQKTDNNNPSQIKIQLSSDRIKGYILKINEIIDIDA